MQIEPIILATYIISLSILFMFASHGYSMVYYYFKTFGKRKEDLSEEELKLTEYPYVTIQLPLYNEKYVICRLIDAIIRLDYPKDKLEIQVLDDSTDETVEIAKEHVQKYIDKG